MPATEAETDLPPRPSADPVVPALGGRSLRLVTAVLAFACGASVANLYYAQPLLSSIAGTFGTGSGTVALVVTLTQVGYALGLLLLLPLGDLLENRRLASRTLLVTAVALVAASAAPSFGVLLAAMALVGCTSVVAQVLVPLAAHLAPPDVRGKVVGQVTGGLLLGIMLARSVASFVAAAWGWRSIDAVSAVVMVLTSLLLRRLLPERRPEHSARYGALLASTVRLARTEPVLVRRALSQALLFAAFTAYWTGVPFELLGRHHSSQVGVAVFALVGAAGAAAAPVAGALGDRGHGRTGRLVTIVLAALAMLLAWLGAGSVVLLAVAGVVLDLSVQSHQVLSLREVYAIRGDARARLNSVFMGTVFVCGALSSALTGLLHASSGWTGVTLLGAGAAVLALPLWPQRRVS
ncbi:putative MFS family arabinose efflux permease [Motilibacter rhizosphaerae]|uniref:Putative MFS family arabinose efflux permease n=1 Tax=Motilibacter rhizosphaerae TaxID=598652 RepID=A0A4Q7NGJ4_9ACTN|nr:MFS transporter [Motilibacter rhizosphaerae]RZS82848.1 putative MFS family arabinose efflux permease [Motilibacter rhizosphaerae]